MPTARDLPLPSAAAPRGVQSGSGLDPRICRASVPSRRSVNADAIGTPLARHPDEYVFYVRRCVPSETAILAGFTPASAGESRHWDAIGTASGRLRRRLVGVYLGLPATAAVADMPVGTPHPFASALERLQIARGQRGNKALARSRRAARALSRSRLRGGCAENKNPELALKPRGRRPPACGRSCGRRL
jgi:hypothetical protein